MIGTITITPKSGFTVEASLDEKGVWACSEPLLAEYLNIFFQPVASPAYGPFGASTIQLVADTFDGKFKLHDYKPSESGRIY